MSLGANLGGLAKAAAQRLIQKPQTPNIPPAYPDDDRVKPMWGPRFPGQLSGPNMDLHHRPVAHNSDGSISTVRSATFGNDDGSATLLPTVVGGKVVSDRAAYQNYENTGQNLGQFTNEDAAEPFSQYLHLKQAAQYDPNANLPELHSQIQTILKALLRRP